MNDLYLYKGRYEDDGTIFTGSSIDDPNSRRFTPGEYYQLSPDDPVLREGEMNFEKAEGPPDCAAQTVAELVEKIVACREWIKGPVAQKVPWKGKVVRAMLEQLTDSAVTLGMTDKELPNIASPVKAVLNTLEKWTGKANDLTEPPVDWQDFRNEGRADGELMTAKFCKDRFNLSGKDLTLAAQENPSIRRKNPDGGSSFVYRYDAVARISDRKSYDK